MRKLTQSSTRYGFLILFLISFVVILHLVTEGVAVSANSAIYVSAGANAALGNGFVRYDGRMMTSSPPFYSILIAFGYLFHLDVWLVAKLISIISFSLLILTSGILYYRSSQSLYWAILLGIVTSFLYPIYFIYSFSCTETVFLLFSNLVFIAFDNFFRERTFGNLALLSLFCIISSLSRYTGIMLTLIVSIGVFIILSDNLFQRLLKTAVFLLVSLLPISLWCLRNYINTGYFAGLRGETSVSIMVPLRQLVEVLGSWLNPFHDFATPSFTLQFLAVAMLILGATSFIIFFPRKMNIKRFSVGFFYGFGYLLWLVITTSIVWLDPITDRYVTPVIIPFLTTISSLIPLLVAKFRDHFIKVACICLVIFLTPLSYSYLQLSQRSSDLFLGDYLKESWMELGTADIVDDLELPVLSNRPDALYVLGGFQGAQWSPLRNQEASAAAAFTTLDDLSQIIEEKGQVEFVWYEDQGRDYLMSPGELTEYFDVTHIDSFPGGAIYVVTSDDL